MLKNRFALRLIIGIAGFGVLAYAVMLAVLLYMPAMTCCPNIF
jgi:hypothetical protein